MLVDRNYEFFISIKEQDILKSFHITFQKENCIRNLFLKGKMWERQLLLFKVSIRNIGSHKRDSTLEEH